MIYFSSNFRTLRQKKNLSQQEIADALQLSRTKVNSYERGVQPPYELLIKIADFFKLSLDVLIKKDIASLNGFELSKILEGSEIDISGKRLRLLTVTIKDNNQENIEMVGIKAQAGYVQGYGDPDFIQNLPKFSMPFLPQNKTYRCFQIKGDSMPPVMEGSWVTASYVQDWNHIKDGDNYIIVTLNEGVVFKRVYNKLTSEKSLTLVSTNSDYAPYDVSVDQISEIWKFETWNGFSF
jgi:transcriptional regulator with XRE-family HTH domain